MKFKILILLPLLFNHNHLLASGNENICSQLFLSHEQLTQSNNQKKIPRLLMAPKSISTVKEKK